MPERATRIDDVSHQDPFDAGIARIADRLASAVPGRTIAVFEFPDLEGQVTNLGRLVSEQLTTELVQRSSGGKVVERRQVVQVLTELNLLKTDLTGDEVKVVARQLGADAIALGTVSVVGDRLLVNARLVGVSGGEVLSAERMSIRAPRELLALAGSGLAAPTLTPKPPQAKVPPSAPARTQSAPEPSQLAPAPVVSTKFGQVTITTSGCSRTGGTVTCRLQLTNTGPDAEFIMANAIGAPVKFPQDSRLYDDSGNLFEAPRFRIGNQEGDHGLGSMLISGVPTDATITSTGIPTSSTRVSLLEIVAGLEVEGDERQWNLLRLRDLPLR